jgi:hypothetical protein
LAVNNLNLRAIRQRKAHLIGFNLAHHFNLTKKSMNN